MNFYRIVIGSALWETVYMPKKKTTKPKTSLSKRTPNQAVHTAAKALKKQGNRIQQIFGDNQLKDLEERSKEDFSQAADRIVKKYY